MRRALVALAAVVASLSLAPAALAATFHVTNENDSGPGSFRQAIISANATAGTDTITFDPGVDTVSPTTDLPPITDTVIIDGNGHVTVSQPSAAAGPLLDFQPGSGGSMLKAITLVGGGAAPTPLVRAGASAITVLAATLRDARTSAVEVRNNATGVHVAQTAMYGYAQHAVDTTNGNAHIQPPQDLRVGPRQPDGTLPITGTTASGGTLEVYSGDKTSNSFLFSAVVGPGQFSVMPPSEPGPGQAFIATITDGSSDTSDHSNRAVTPSDVVSPFLVGGVADSFQTVEIQASEPIDPATLDPGDFSLEIAATDRPITAVSASSDGTRIELTTSKPWDPGEAGDVHLSAPGAITDRAGNASLTTNSVRVGGAPGDFIAPVVTSFHLKPNKKLCWIKGSRCRRAGTALIFASSEDGDAFGTVFRGSRFIGERRFNGQPGDNFIHFDGKIRGQRLRPGRYKMYMAVEDAVGNRLPLDQQPSYVFSVKSTRGQKVARAARHRR